MPKIGFAFGSGVDGDMLIPLILSEDECSRFLNDPRIKAILDKRTSFNVPKMSEEGKGALRSSYFANLIQIILKSYLMACPDQMAEMMEYADKEGNIWREMFEAFMQVNS